MQIKAMTMAGYQLLINMREDASILELKDKLREYLGIPPHQLVVLAEENNTYPDDKTLSEVLAEGGGKPFVVKVDY